MSEMSHSFRPEGTVVAKTTSGGKKCGQMLEMRQRFCLEPTSAADPTSEGGTGGRMLETRQRFLRERTDAADSTSGDWAGGLNVGNVATIPYGANECCRFDIRAVPLERDRRQEGVIQ